MDVAAWLRGLDLGQYEAAFRDNAVDDADVLRRALLALPPRQRAAVVLRHYEDRSEAETAQVLGCSVGTVKSLSSRGLAALRAAASTEASEGSAWHG